MDQITRKVVEVFINSYLNQGYMKLFDGDWEKVWDVPLTNNSDS